MRYSYGLHSAARPHPHHAGQQHSPSTLSRLNTLNHYSPGANAPTYKMEEKHAWVEYRPPIPRESYAQISFYGFVAFFATVSMVTV